MEKLVYVLVFLALILIAIITLVYFVFKQPGSSLPAAGAAVSVEESIPENGEDTSNRPVITGKTSSKDKLIISLKIGVRNYKGAAKDCDRAIAVNPDDDDLYSRRAYCRLEMKDYEGAISDTDKAISINPGVSRYYFLRGRAEEMTDLVDEARQDYKKASDLGNENAKQALFDLKKYNRKPI